MVRQCTQLVKEVGHVGSSWLGMTLRAESRTSGRCSRLGRMQTRVSQIYGACPVASSHIRAPMLLAASYGTSFLRKPERDGCHCAGREIRSTHPCQNAVPLIGRVHSCSPGRLYRQRGSWTTREPVKLAPRTLRASGTHAGDPSPSSPESSSLSSLPVSPAQLPPRSNPSRVLPTRSAPGRSPRTASIRSTRSQ